MSTVPPDDWRSVADLPGTSYVDTIAEYTEKVMTDLAVAESRDILAALAAWSDIDGINDPANILRIKYHNDGPQVRLDRDESVFARASAPKVVLEVPTLIVLADIRHAAGGRGQLEPVDWRRHERTYTGERYTVALMHRDEAAKIPREVRTGNDIIEFIDQSGMDD